MRKDNEVERLDSTYFLRSDVERLHRIQSMVHSRIGDICYVTDGIHTSIDFDEGSGIKVISAKHPKDGFLELGSFEEISALSHAANPRTALHAGDVLISTVGTIGNAAVVRSEILPANSDRHVGIMRVLPKAERPISPEYLCAFLIGAYGRMQSLRETTGNVQPNLFLVKIRNLKVVRLSDSFEKQIHFWSLESLTALREADDKQRKVESALTSALGLAEWRPPEPLSYSASAARVRAAGRIDAQYFMPAKEQVKQSLRAMPGRLLSDRVDSIREQFLADRAAAATRVRNYDVTDALVPLLDAEKEPSIPSEIGSMKKVFKDGDVVISRLRAYLKEIAVVRTEDDIPSVGSSEFIVLRPRPNEVSPETLMAFLRSPPVQTVLKWCQDGSQHPRFSESDLLSIPVPDVILEISESVTKIVQEGFAARRRARKLLQVAKRAVEIAIEDSEEAAVIYLSQQTEAA